MKNKALVKFIVMMVICLLVGMVGGFLAAFLGDNTSPAALGDLAAIVGFYGAPILSLLAFLVVLGIAVPHFNKAKQSAEIWDGDDEEVIDDAENKLNIALIASNTGFSLGSVLLSVFICAMLSVADKGAVPRNAVTRASVIVGIGVYVVNLIFSVVFQQKILNLIKKISPEKQANVYDSKFESKWMDSCDEAEKVIIYKSGYKAYSNTVKVINVLWVCSVFGAVLFKIDGWVPIVIGIIWMTLIVSYQMEAYRLEKH